MAVLATLVLLGLSAAAIAQEAPVADAETIAQQWEKMLTAIEKKQPAQAEAIYDKLAANPNFTALRAFQLADSIRFEKAVRKIGDQPEYQSLVKKLDSRVKAVAAVQENWEQLLHYINIARPELAASYGKAIVDSKDATPKLIYLLSGKKPGSLKTLRKGQNLEGLDEMCKNFRVTIEKGYKAWRSDPEEIEESIRMMGRTLRGYRIGKQRLIESGEYAIPQLIEKLISPKTPQVLKDRIVTMLGSMGRNAVRAFSVALQSKDTKLVEFLANALKEIQYPSALPRLREVLMRPGLNDTTVKIVKAAMISCSGGDRAVLEKSPAELFYQLADKYYTHAESVMPDPRFGDAFVWFWKDGTGVEQIPVPKAILCDIYAMRMARMAIKHDATHYPAVPLWLSACVRREIDLPAGKTDPLWPKDKPTAAYYLLASSPRYLQQVLGRAMKDANVPIATRVIDAMRRNTGAPSLVDPLPGGAQPLVSAMGYPDRGVRFLAAETLALAQPTKLFNGSPVVLSLMNEALRQKGKKYAMVIAKDDEKRNILKDAVRAAGYLVIDESDTSKVLISARKAVGLDVVVIGPDLSPMAVVNTFRRETIYYYMPIVISRMTPGLRQIAKVDGKIVLVNPAKVDEETVAKALSEAIKLSAGKPLSEAQALEWAIRAAKVVRSVGIRRGSIYDVHRSTASLAEALKSENNALRIAAAEALAVIDSAVAQQAIVTLALDGGADEAVRVAAFNAASESVRHFGNECTDAQSKAVKDVVIGAGSHKLLQAAAQLLGTMNLPSEKGAGLILSTDGID